MTPDAHALAAHYLAQAREHGPAAVIQALAILLAKERAAVRVAHRLMWTVLATVGEAYDADEFPIKPAPCNACQAMRDAAEWVRKNAKQEGAK